MQDGPPGRSGSAFGLELRKTGRRHSQDLTEFAFGGLVDEDRSTPAPAVIDLHSGHKPAPAGRARNARVDSRRPRTRRRTIGASRGAPGATTGMRSTRLSKPMGEASITSWSGSSPSPTPELRALPVVVNLSYESPPAARRDEHHRNAIDEPSRSEGARRRRRAGRMAGKTATSTASRAVTFAHGKRSRFPAVQRRRKPASRGRLPHARRRQAVSG